MGRGTVRAPSQHRGPSSGAPRRHISTGLSLLSLLALLSVPAPAAATNGTYYCSTIADPNSACPLCATGTPCDVSTRATLASRCQSLTKQAHIRPAVLAYLQNLTSADKFYTDPKVCTLPDIPELGKQPCACSPHADAPCTHTLSFARTLLSLAAFWCHHCVQRTCPTQTSSLGATSATIQMATLSTGVCASTQRT